nr:MAG TPA: zinc knuckle protein [Caudoviricetes sp.]
MRWVYDLHYNVSTASRLCFLCSRPRHCVGRY